MKKTTYISPSAILETEIADVILTSGTEPYKDDIEWEMDIINGKE